LSPSPKSPCIRTTKIMQHFRITIRVYRDGLPVRDLIEEHFSFHFCPCIVQKVPLFYKMIRRRKFFYNKNWCSHADLFNEISTWSLYFTQFNLYGLKICPNGPRCKWTSLAHFWQKCIIYTRYISIFIEVLEELQIVILDKHVPIILKNIFQNAPQFF
jgi:hypothetical protein